jgi:hypothetical protein
VADRLCARTPVADQFITASGGEEGFCRLIIGRVVESVEVDWGASRRAPLTVYPPTVLTLPDGASVAGPGYAKVVDAHPIRPFEGIAEQMITYVCVCYEPLGPGEVGTDTSGGDSEDHD